MKKYFLLIILSIASFTLQAQVPGYLGKRGTIDYKFNIFPAQTYLLGQTDAPLLTITMRHELSASYALGRKFALGGYFQTGNSNVWHRWNSIDNNGFSIVNSDSYRWKVTSFGADLRFYSGDFLSPLGSYHQFSMGKISYRYDDETLFESRVTYNEFGSPIGFEQKPVDLDRGISGTVLSYGYFSSKLITGSVYYISGFQFNAIFGTGDNLLIRLNNGGISQELAVQARRNVGIQQALLLKFGIGLLL